MMGNTDIDPAQPQLKVRFTILNFRRIYYAGPVQMLDNH